MNSFLQVNGAQLEVSVCSPKVNQDQEIAVLLLHEGLGCVASWKDFPQQLAYALQLDVITYSRIGYGNSSPVDVPRPLTYMHIEAQQWLPGVVAQLPYNQFILIGHSDGGSIALIYAGSASQKNLLGVVTLAAHVHNEALCVTSIEKARQAYMHGDLRAGLAQYHGANVDGAFWGWNQAWLDPDFMRWNIEEYLPCIRVPVLVIQGDDDEYGSAKQAQTIAACAGSHTEVLMIPDCRHLIHRDAPATLLNALQQFINSLLG
ncbi:MAG: alpha/beta hydrolase [Gammaproteobacteria bacterium]|nr:alpha/beta hydrolase [Gammaproteobacteria bacterium]